MKNKMNVTKNLIAVVMIIAVLMSGLTACGKKQKLSGLYVPENPNSAGVVFTSLEFEGSTVHVEAGGSNIGFEYNVRNGVFSFRNSFTFNVDGENVPTSFEFVQNEDGSFTLDGVKYVKL